MCIAATGPPRGTGARCLGQLLILDPLDDDRARRDEGGY